MSIATVPLLYPDPGGGWEITRLVCRKGAGDEMLMSTSATLPACGLLVSAAGCGQTRHVAPGSREGMCLHADREESAVAARLPLTAADLSAFDQVAKWSR